MSPYRGGITTVLMGRANNSNTWVGKVMVIVSLLDKHVKKTVSQVKTPVSFLKLRDLVIRGMNVIGMTVKKRNVSHLIGV